MKKFYSVTVLAFLMLALAVSNAEAQRFTKKKRYHSYSVHLNAMNYFGDIVPEPDFTSLRLASTRPNIGVSYSYRVFPRVTGRAMFSWGRITGDDKKSASTNEEENIPRYKRNLSFRNDIKELSLTAMVDLFENRSTYLKRPDFSPYAFAGVAVFAHNPKAEYNGTFVALQPLGTEGQYAANREDKDYPKPYSLVQFSIPFGLGVKYKLDKNWDLGFEIGWRKTFTDYLDDVSGTYANKADLTSETARALSDRSGESGLAPNAVKTDGSGLFIVKYVEDPLSPTIVPLTDKNGNITGFAKGRINGYGAEGDQRGDITDKDWYIVTGFSLTYIIPGRGKGPKFR